MNGIKNLIDNFEGEIVDLCFEILKNTSNKEAVFEYTCINLLRKPEKGTIDIQKYFTQEEMDSYESLYGSTINGLIKMSANKCNSDIISKDLFYSDLWQSFCKNFTTDKELAFAFYYTVIDSAIPYQYLGKTLTMSDERFQQLSKENKLYIDKIKYIKNNRMTQRTEDASLLLNCLDEIDDREVKVVVLAHALSILGTRASSMSREKIDRLIQQIDQKIKELESEKGEGNI